jgi:uncharacterized membrane protein
MSKEGKYFIIGGAYADAGEALKDYTAIQAMHAEGMIGDYDSGLLTKEADGTVIVTTVDATGHFKTAGAGAMVGAVLGLAFPPAMVGLAALGASVGGMIGPLRRKMAHRDFKQLATLLNPGESGVVLLAESISEIAALKVLPGAMRSRAVEVEGGKAEIQAALNEATHR